MTFDPAEMPPPDFDTRPAFAVPPRIVDPIRQRRNRSNKRNGRDAQRMVSRMVGARDIGTLGGIDLDGGWFWGEVKNTHGLPEWMKKGMEQLGVRSDRPCYLFVRNVRAGIKSQVYVIETLDQWLATRGVGTHGNGD